MGGHRWNTEAGPGPGRYDQPATDWARQALSLRADEWSSDRVLDPGDSHVKGEDSLCVGEAA